MKLSNNRPLNHQQVKQLRRATGYMENIKGNLRWVETFNGFTPTSDGRRGQDTKQLLFRLGKARGQIKNNRKGSNGRIIQLVPIFARDAEGHLPVNEFGKEVRRQIGVRRVIHLGDPGRLINK